MEPPSSSISVLNESGRPLRAALIKGAVKVALSQHGLDRASVCVLLTGDESVRTLNRTYRGIDEPTDVLTFPSDKGSGDIAISVPYAERQAKERRVSLTQELCYLAIHGALHLAGLDDETEADRAHMVQQMNRAAAAVGIQPDLNWASLLHDQAEAAK